MGIKEPRDHVTQVDYSKIDKENELKAKNPKFVQMYENKMSEIRKHTLANPTAVSLFMFLSEFMGKDNLVIVPQSVLMEEMEISRTTLWRAIQYLETKELVVVVKFGNVHGYAVNPEYVWKSVNTPEKYALFSNVKALASKSENEAIQRKLAHVFGRKKHVKGKEKAGDDRQTDLVDWCESKAS